MYKDGSSVVPPYFSRLTAGLIYSYIGHTRSPHRRDACGVAQSFDLLPAQTHYNYSTMLEYVGMNKILDVPYFHQTKSDTCGLAALSMVLHHFNKKIKETEIEKLLTRVKNKQSFHIADIGRIALEYGFISEIFCYDFTNIFSTEHIGLSSKELEIKLQRWMDRYKFNVYRKPYLEFLKAGGELKVAIPHEEFIQSTLDKNIPLIALVESRPFYGNIAQKNAGHIVVIIGYDDEHFYIHDPLDPSKKHAYGKSAKISKEFFYFCWYRRFANTLILRPQ